MAVTSELADLLRRGTPPPPPGQVEMHMIDDLPPDPRPDGADEGLGNYRGGSA